MCRSLVVSGSGGSFGRDGTAWQLRLTAFPDACGRIGNWTTTSRRDVAAGTHRASIRPNPAVGPVDAAICHQCPSSSPPGSPVHVRRVSPTRHCGRVYRASPSSSTSLLGMPGIDADCARRPSTGTHWRRQRMREGWKRSCRDSATKRAGGAVCVALRYANQSLSSAISV